MKKYTFNSTYRGPKTVEEVEQSLLNDYLREVDPKDEVGTMRATKKARLQAGSVHRLHALVKSAQLRAGDGYPQLPESL